MKIRNLEIVDSLGLAQSRQIEDRISELDNFISQNYNLFGKEVAVEFNLGSRITPYSMHLVIYNNPDRNNNPYIFIMAKLNNEKVLTSKAELAFFNAFIDYQTFRDFKTSLRTGFENLPKFALLGEKEIEKARQMSTEFDER